MGEVTGLVAPPGGGGSGSGLPAGGSVGQVVVNTGSGTGTWGDVLDLVDDPNGTTTITTPAAGQAAVSAAIPTSVWASRGSGLFTGALKRMTDIGASPGTVMQWDGTYWKVLGRTTLYFDTSQTNGTTAGTLQVVKQFSAPAGLLRAGRYVWFAASAGKTAAGDAWTSFSLKIGTLGTTSDSQFVSSSVGANTVLSFGLNTYAIFSTTNTTQMGGNNNTSGGFSGQTSTSAPHTAANTISNIDSNPVFFSACIQLAGTASTPQVWDMIVELVP